MLDHQVPGTLRCALRSAFLLVPLALAACGSSGGSGTGSGTPTGNARLDLVLDTRAGQPVNVRSVLDAVLLEHADGSRTTHVPPGGSTAIVLADPAGEPAALSVPTDGRAVTAVWLALGGGTGTLSGRGVSGRSVDLGSAMLRVQVPPPSAPAAGGSRRCLHVGHRTPVPGDVATSGRWPVEFGAVTSGGMVWDSVDLQVVAVDPAAGTVTATWNATASFAPITLRFGPESILHDDARRLLDLPGFLAALSPGRWLEVDGLFAPADYTLDVRRAHLEDGAPGGGGGNTSEPKVVAVVEGIDCSTETLTVRVLQVRRAPSAGGPVPDVLTVDGSTARISRSSSSWIPLPFCDLAVGNVVEIEWRGPAAGGSVRATEIELEHLSPGGGQGQDETEGEVASVDTAASTIRVVPRGDDPLLVEGNRVGSALVEIDAGTHLYLDDPSNPITLSRVPAGARIQIKWPTRIGTGPRGEPRIRGDRVRIRIR